MTATESERDRAWLESLKDNGHCGEGTSEMQSRFRLNDRIDRILALLPTGGVGSSGGRLPSSQEGSDPLAQHSAGKGEITITRAEARRLVNYAFMASSANWTPFISENGVSGVESPWCEFLRIADRLWVVLFPDHDIRRSDPRLPADKPEVQPGGDADSGAATEAEPSGAVKP